MSHRSVLLLCLLGALPVTPVAADDHEITFGDGGDCALLGGAWSQTTQTCLLVGLSVGPNDQLLIVAHANLIGATRVAGTLETTAKMTVSGTFENSGFVRNHGTMRVLNRLANHGTLINGATMNVCPQAPDLEQLHNFGVLANAGQISSCGSTNSGDWYQCGAGGSPAGLPVIATIDGDADAVCPGVDCDDGNAVAWAAPGEVGRITLSRTAGRQRPVFAFQSGGL